MYNNPQQSTTNAANDRSTYPEVTSVHGLRVVAYASSANAASNVFSPITIFRAAHPSTSVAHVIFVAALDVAHDALSSRFAARAAGDQKNQTHLKAVVSRPRSPRFRAFAPSPRAGRTEPAAEALESLEPNVAVAALDVLARHRASTRDEERTAPGHALFDFASRRRGVSRDSGDDTPRRDDGWRRDRAVTTATTSTTACARARGRGRATRGEGRRRTTTRDFESACARRCGER